MNAKTFTPGPWEFTRTASGQEFVSVCDFRVAMTCDVDVATRKANGRLIAEAGTVASECGMTPRQLAEQRAELVEALRGMLAIHDSVTMWQERELRGEWIPKARAALAKAGAP